MKSWNRIMTTINKHLNVNSHVSSLSAAPKRLASGWWRHDFAPGFTLLARDLERQRRERRRYKNWDANRQRDARRAARYLWEKFPDCLPDAGHA